MSTSAAARREASPPPVEFDVPRYVQACIEGRWHIHSWTYDPKSGEVLKEGRARYRCLSWRHPGPCRRWRAAQNFSRVSTALARCEPKSVAFMVLTIDPKEWADRWEAFSDLKHRWRSLAKAIRRRFGDFDNVTVLEVHRSGWPHLNVVLVNDQFGALAAKPHRAKAWLVPHLMACGFGRIAFVERARSRRALAGYAVKLAGDIEAPAELDASGHRLTGEVVKFSQVPEHAPPHTRRLRSSKGFLPPPFKRLNVGGELIRSPLPIALEGKSQ